MPRIKRWFHLSQEINRDPQFREFAKRFRLGGVRFWLECLAILDRTDNFWDLHKGFDLGLLAASCETKKEVILKSYEHLRDINWLKVGVDINHKLFIYAPKWAEYNQRREDKGTNMGTPQYEDSTYPTPSPSPTPKREIYKEKVSKVEPIEEALNAFEDFWKAYPARNGKKLGKLDAQEKFLAITKEDCPLVIKAAQNYSTSEQVQDGVGIKDAKRFLQKNKNGSEFWREWITPEIAQNGKGELKLCSSRIEVEGNLKTCKRPATKMIGKSFICDECYDHYQKKQGSVKQKGEASAN